MAMTPADFRAAFPVYGNTITYPDAQINYYLTIGYKLHNPERWGNLLDFGVMLWTAHSLAMDAEGRKAGASPGALRGNITSMSADGLSWSRDLATVVDAKAGHWNLTSYGLRWRDLVNMVGSGPLHVGAPGLYDMYLTGGGTGFAWPWPGPDYNVTW